MSVLTEPIISVSHVSKRYRLGKIGMTSLRDEIQRWWERRRAGKTRSKPTEFWALRDVSFDVEPGQVVGIIDRNGAGKSTMLKLLSRITEPTSGEIHLRGRVASLLEVGTGFHPELSGRENIYLNGAVLGMTKAEIRRKFDEIVEFSEIGKFIDTPVKRYSSGMYVRLAFAVAAHLEPEILIIDEVLAVGDVAFQRKCLGKVQDISRNSNRTVLFVSHNMNAIETICSACVWLRGGQLVAQGRNVREIVRSYVADQSQRREPMWTNPGKSWHNDWFQLNRFYATDGNGALLTHPARNDEPVNVVIEGEVLKPDASLQVGYGLYNGDGDLLYWSTNLDQPEAEWVHLEKGPCRLTSQIPPRFVNEGEYRIDLLLRLYRRAWICEPGGRSPNIHFEIRGGLSESPCWIERRPGCVAPVLPWDVRTGVESFA